MRVSRLPLTCLVLGVLLCGCGSSPSGGGGANRPGSPGHPAAPPGAVASACQSGDSDVVNLKATGAGCAEARQVMSGWRRARECDKYGGEARKGCSLLSYRCVATAAGRGWSVSCAKPARSIAFLIRRG